MEPLVLIEHRDGVALLTLNRASRANAYNSALLGSLRGALDALDGSVRVVVLTGTGGHFCGGADLDEMRERHMLDALHLESARTFDHLAALATPTIAAVNGAALGGGLELALACDLRVASEDAIFGLPETSLGIIPAAGGTLRLPRVVGEGRAREMIFTGRRITAAAAREYGLVNEVVAGCVTEAALELAREIARNDPLAIRMAKQCLQNGVTAYPTVVQALLYHRREQAAGSHA